MGCARGGARNAESPICGIRRTARVLLNAVYAPAVCLLLIWGARFIGSAFAADACGAPKAQSSYWLQIAGIISRALYDTAFARRVPLCAWYFDFYARVSQRIPRALEQPRLQLIENQMIANGIENALTCSAWKVLLTLVPREEFRRLVKSSNKTCNST
jgi:hypothetical protein